MRDLEQNKLKVIVIGNGKYVINQYPLKGKKVLADSKVFLLSNGLEFKMEDMTGWSINDVKTYTELLGIKLEYNGYGYVTSQSIDAGTVLDTSNMVLSVTLENKT